MKIHNLGNDYAFQQKLKKGDKVEKPGQPIVEPESNLINNVEHKVSTGGETAMATTDNEADAEEFDGSQKISRKRKKKENNDLQQTPEC